MIAWRTAECFAMDVQPQLTDCRMTTSEFDDHLLAAQQDSTRHPAAVRRAGDGVCDLGWGAEPFGAEPLTARRARGGVHGQPVLEWGSGRSGLEAFGGTRGLIENRKATNSARLVCTPRDADAQDWAIDCVRRATVVVRSTTRNIATIDNTPRLA